MDKLLSPVASLLRVVMMRKFRLFASNFSIRLGEPDSLRVHGPAVAEDWQVTLVETGSEAMTGCRLKRIERRGQAPACCVDCARIGHDCLPAPRGRRTNVGK